MFPLDFTVDTFENPVGLTLVLFGDTIISFVLTHLMKESTVRTHFSTSKHSKSCLRSYSITNAVKKLKAT